jgi:hypothetical protein
MVLQGPQDSSDMGIRPAFVYNTSVTGGGPIAVPVEYTGDTLSVDRLGRPSCSCWKSAFVLDS